MIVPIHAPCAYLLLMMFGLLFPFLSWISTVNTASSDGRPGRRGRAESRIAVVLVEARIRAVFFECSACVGGAIVGHGFNLDGSCWGEPVKSIGLALPTSDISRTFFLFLSLSRTSQTGDLAPLGAGCLAPGLKRIDVVLVGVQSCFK